MAATTPSKALLWSGVGVSGVGVVALLLVAVADLGKADQIASVAGAVLALVGIGLSLWAQFGNRGQAPVEGAVEASGARSVAAGGSVGAVVTGDGVQAPAAPPAMPAGGGPTVSGPVTASGDRSVAAGGDIGSVSTGDA
ncbi:hypothetical protein [Streptomyces sp. NPDC056169]|uniref:hypothetical protein n=1 Tax=Streptomyces sp. NPDC056169 TaxID=3345734 RepID=UPI0035DB0231